MCNRYLFHQHQVIYLKKLDTLLHDQKVRDDFLQSLYKYLSEGP